MRKLIIATLVLLAPALLVAQDVIYLKNGSVIKGEVIEKKANGGITVRLDNGRTVEYSQFDVREISQDATRSERMAAKKYTAFEEQVSGYFFAAELGFGSSVGEDGGQIAPIGFSVVNGFRFSEFLSAGVGIGVRSYVGGANKNIRTVNSDRTVFPIYFDLRGNFVSHKSRNLVPYWSMDVGYTLVDKDIFFSPTVGLSIGGNRNNFIVGITYMGQFIERPNKDSKDVLDMLGLKVGFQF